MEFITYAALATVGDASPIIDDNRILVRHGFTNNAVNHISSYGFTELLRQSRITNECFTQDDAAFKIVPQINAAGRMEDPKLAYGLFVEKDRAMVEQIAECLKESNAKRKFIQKQIEKEAEIKVHQGNFTHGILLYEPSWHIGVIGIVASRIVETFHKPTLILGSYNGVIKGSGRSMKNYSLKKIMDNCNEMFERYGGHELAAGATLKSEYIDKASAIFDKACAIYCEEFGIKAPSKQMDYDVELKVENIKPDIIDMLGQNLYPYCEITNPEPVFKVSNVLVSNVSCKESETWSMLTCKASKDGAMIPFTFRTFSNKYGTDISGRIADIYFTFPQVLNCPKSDLSIVDMEIKG
jgi:single-stranded-DNA-specific exonuclease